MAYPDGKIHKIEIVEQNPTIGDHIHFKIEVKNEGIEGPINVWLGICDKYFTILSRQDTFSTNEIKTYTSDYIVIDDLSRELQAIIVSINPDDNSDRITTDSRIFTIEDLLSEEMSIDIELIPDNVGEDAFTIRYGDRRGIKVSVTGGTSPYTYKLYKQTNHGDIELVSLLSDDNLVYLSNFEYDDKFYFVDEIKCGQETEHYSSGIDLLYAYDLNNDGILDDNEFASLYHDYTSSGLLSENEYNIGALCHDYYNGYISDMYSLMTIRPDNPISQRYIVYVEDSSGNIITGWFDMTIHRGKESPCPPYGSVVAPSCPSYDGSTVSFVTMLDVQMIASIIVGITWNDLKKYLPETMTEEKFGMRLDVNNDNELNITDIMMLAQYFRDVRNTFPVCEEECSSPSCNFTIG